jgi:hypothetical protein
MKEYKIYMEGFVATGQSAKAQLLATVEGETFTDACDRMGRLPKYKRDYKQGNPPTYWGCKLYDNIEDARKSFG